MMSFGGMSMEEISMRITRLRRTSSSSMALMRSRPMRMSLHDLDERYHEVGQEELFNRSNEEGNDHGNNDHEESGDEVAIQENRDDKHDLRKLYAMNF
jgi:hypothetical protein